MAVLMLSLNPVAARTRSRARSRRPFPALLVVSISALLSSLIAEAEISREHQLKAVLLFNLTRFVEWPDSAFDTPEAPLVIGVLGHDPFGTVLEEVVRGETVHNRHLVIERYPSVSSVKRCHLLFVSRNERRQFKTIISRLNGQPILTVADTYGFIRPGGLVQLFTRLDGKIGLRINADATKASNLAVSAKLLRLAEIVFPEDH